jgi:hypothetical protein
MAANASWPHRERSSASEDLNRIRKKSSTVGPKRGGWLLTYMENAK